MISKRRVGTSLLWLFILEMAAPRVAVVGAGVIGLSTALCIMETCPSCSVTILSEQFSPNTTSDVAAGMLIPHTYPGMCSSAWYCSWYLMRLQARMCRSAQRLRKKSAMTCVHQHWIVRFCSFHYSSVHVWVCLLADTPIHMQKQWFKETFTYLFAISNSAEASEAGIHLVSG